MFLFICRIYLFMFMHFVFKYILCSYLSVLYDLFINKKEDLNTSYVLIYRYCKVPRVWQNQFKYILCSYLSIYPVVMYCFRFNLNTSYVLIYHSLVSSMILFWPNLNTSYVLIYREEYDQDARINIFKYILCSYLSKKKLEEERCLKLFKYILCSYLSEFKRSAF